MEYTVKKNENATVDLNLTFTAEEIEKAYVKAYQKASHKVQLNGFRKGKAPLEMVQKILGESVADDAINILINETLLELYPKMEHFPIKTSKVEIEKFERNSILIGKVIYETRPETVLGNYKSIPLNIYNVKVEDKDIKKDLFNIQYSLSKTVLKEAGSKSEKGDLIQIEVEVSSEETHKNSKPEPLSYHIGAEGNHLGFDDHLIGLSENEVKEFDYTYPTDFLNPDLAGKQLHYKVKVNSVYSMNLPELNDELANEYNGTKTIEDLKNNIKGDIIKFYNSQLEKKYNLDLLSIVLENTKFIIPRSLIEDESKNVFHDFLHQVKMDHHMSMEKFAEISGQDVKLVKESFEKRAEYRLKQVLALYKISEVEKLIVTDTEYDDHITNYANETKYEKEDILKMIQKNRSEVSIREKLLFDKVYKFLMENANKQNSNELTLEEIIKMLNEKHLLDDVERYDGDH